MASLEGKVSKYFDVLTELEKSQPIKLVDLKKKLEGKVPEKTLEVIIRRLVDWGWAKKITKGVYCSRNYSDRKHKIKLAFKELFPKGKPVANDRICQEVCSIARLNFENKGVRDDVFEVLISMSGRWLYH